MCENVAAAGDTVLTSDSRVRRVRDRALGKLHYAQRGPTQVLNKGRAARPLNPAFETLRRSALLGKLDDDLFTQVSVRSLRRRVLAGEYLADGSVELCALYVVANGRARCVKMMNGRAVILRDIEEGEWFGQLSSDDDQRASTQIVAITDMTVVHIPLAVFRQAVHQCPEFGVQVFAGLTRQINALNDRFSEQVSLTTRERLCIELLRHSRRITVGRIVVSPPPSHEELGNRIGGLRETITRMLIALERDGLITRSRSAITLIDVPRLRRIAEAKELECR